MPNICIALHNYEKTHAFHDIAKLISQKDHLELKTTPVVMYSVQLGGNSVMMKVDRVSFGVHVKGVLLH